MEIEGQIDNQFSSIKNLISRICTAVREGQDKLILEPLTKELVICLYKIKLFIQNIDSMKPKGSILRDEIERLRKEISEQEKMISELEPFKY
ncbi:hypothetical protein SteCoe_25451 [Stentor coeruleus]|uniref:Uncharacterized protein n=1 Tax=Stentor coeruleus TaxID=5963 RepID=A0A1R2BFA8_9CILI|nr:hypothetical protein SteCoe_25451 [Stentor coeruleus]